jgi:hypothetical protein
MSTTDMSDEYRSHPESRVRAFWTAVKWYLLLLFIAALCSLITAGKGLMCSPQSRHGLAIG